MGKDVGIVRVDMIFKGHVSKTETEMNILWRNWSIQSGRRSAGIICCSPVIRWSSRCPGGADSVCLLSLLADMREEMGLKLRSLHVHHGLRGEEADRDGDFP